MGPGRGGWGSPLPMGEFPTIPTLVGETGPCGGSIPHKTYRESES